MAETMLLEFISASGDPVAMVVDHDMYVSIKGAVAREELPEQTLPKWGEDVPKAEPDDPSKTDGRNSTRQQTPPGKTAVPPTSTPAMTGSPKPPNEGAIVTNPFEAAPVDAAETESVLGDNGGNEGTAAPVKSTAKASTTKTAAK